MIQFSESLEDIHLPSGFLFASAVAGIKQSGNPDLALALAPQSANAAALFTRNRVVAAPVLIGREHLRLSGGKLRALIVNSGNANCATGKAGLKAAQAICKAVSQGIGAKKNEVLPSSTGIIGVPLPQEKIIAALPQLIASAHSNALPLFARAIMTTDTRPKIASAEIRRRGQRVRIAGVAKGAGMVHPNMATMLVYLFSDVQASAAALQKALKTAADETLNCISIDGDTSTNDTALLMASGASAISLRALGHEFSLALAQVCRSLARQIISDGEGVKHIISLKLSGARSLRDARQVAQSIARSPLVKTAWAGCDPNWGRILCAIGNSGIAINPGKISISIGPHQVCRRGAVGNFDPAAAHKLMQQPEYDIHIDLGSGRAVCEYLACDLSEEYVRINADYST